MKNAYRFRSKDCPRRHHYLCAYADSDDQLQAAIPKVIIEAFQEQHMTERVWSPHKNRKVTIVRRLVGFKGDRRWVNGTLNFSIRSPELPFLGAEASRLCPDVPIMYWSVAENAGTPRRFFLNGEELDRDAIPHEYAEKFALLEEKRTGFIPGRLTIDAFLSVGDEPAMLLDKAHETQG